MTRPRTLYLILLKAVILFALFNVVYYVAQPLRFLNRVSIYNAVVPGRMRLAFSEFPQEAHNLTVLSFDQLLASHEIARPKAADEYRVVMLGDSAVWGFLLQPSQTQAACLNRLGLTLPNGKKVRVYNLGYPKLSVVKDLLILRHALDYQPDLILWPVTLASLYPTDQLDFPVLTAQYDEVAALVAQNQLKLPQWPLSAPTWIERTFPGQRRALADWLRYQLEGFNWAATGIDHVIPRFMPPYDTALVPDENILSVNVMNLTTVGKISPEDLSFDVMKAGVDAANGRGIPTLIINEPTVNTKTSDVRYNRFYPKWAYDSYRSALKDTADKNGWNAADLWDAIPPEQYTDTEFHLTPDGNCALAEKLREPLLALASP